MPAPPNLPGGQLYMEYRHTPSGERHTLRIHLAYFDPAPIDEINNRAYTSDGPVVPTDATIVDSYNSFAALWQQYYNAEWELRCVALLRYDSFTEVVLTPTPDYPVHNGTDTTETSDKLYFERKYKLLSKTGSRRELILAGVIDTTLRPHSFYVGASSGGVDARDQALMAYFSGASGTGFVMPDGNYAFSDTEMSVWWNKQPEATDHPGVIVDNCLVFPEGAALCNPSTDVVTLHTPMGDFTYDATGIMLPGGWRIDNDAQFIGLADTPDDRLFVIRRPDGRGMVTVAQSGIFFDFGLSGEPDFITRNLHLVNGEWKLSGSTFTYFTDLEPAGTGFDGGAINMGAHAELQLPFGNATSAPTDLLVKDPDSGVPRYYPTNLVAATTGTERLGGGGDAVPLGSETCTGMRCGISGECMKHLVSLYGGWSDWLSPLVSGVADFALLALVIDPFFDALIGSLELASDIAIAGGIKKVLEAGVGAITGSLFPSLSSDDQESIQHGLFCQLACVGSTVSVTTTDINPVWHDYVAGLTLDGLSRDVLTLLIQFTPLADWQAVALHSGPSGLCDAWSCP